MTRFAAVVVATIVLAGNLFLPADGAQAAVVDPPNIVVFYVDDAAAHDGRLWNSSGTPALREHFVDGGTYLPNAIGETPLCCPGRAALLTGLHTHNHGVTLNDVRLFDPREHIGHAMKRAGYATMFMGKYFNKASQLTASQWAAHSAGWTHLDVFRGGTGCCYFDYSLHTKEGNLKYVDYHSTRMIHDRTIMRMRQTAPDTPIFAVLSTYNLHGPNMPMPEFAGSERCASMPPWKPPNYNEADVSDKPAHIRKLPLLPDPGGWPMVRYCEEMLGVDWMVEGVIRELEAQGRLANTLLVFTADNGMAWGAHRLGQAKYWPYTTPVPLHMSWPARWGPSGRTIEERVSNIDLAPTFCAIGGCTLGPYPGGQAAPDGLNLLPLLEGSVNSLGRDAVLEQGTGPPSWTALRTTSIHPRGLWHYVEYSTGERELYDLKNDPWELQNLAAKAGRADLVADLAHRLAELRREGVVEAPAGPDLFVALAKTGPWKGKDVYASTPIASQTQKRTGVAAGQTYKYWIRVQNDGQDADRITLHGTILGTGKMTVSYLLWGTDISAQVNSGTYITPSLAPGAYVTVVVRITVGSTAVAGDITKVLLRGTSVGDPALVDVARAVIKR